MKVSEQRTELRGLSAEELQQRAKDLEDLTFRMRIQKSMGQTESANKMRPLRREMARIQTLLREKGVRS
ncbi:MAG: 50S ribosomal protein L29 [Acidobacteria bacterium]|jgi:large subunit ribosomal protein L29|nr:50S ribosomal protein L29 [Acidobacteriota bacterium]HQX81796.1 50S ribosomal protein L29 [Vicinamibacterales bacterium]